MKFFISIIIILAFQVLPQNKSDYYYEGFRSLLSEEYMNAINSFNRYIEYERVNYNNDSYLRYDKAYSRADLLKTHTELTEDNISWELFNIAESFTKIGKLNEAAEMYEFLINNVNYSKYKQISLLNVGIVFYNLEKYDLSRERLLYLIQKYPFSEDVGTAYYLIAETYAKQQDYDNAIYYYLMALDKRSQNRIVDYTLYSLAEAYEVKNDLKSAIQYYDELISFHRRSELYPMAQIKIGVCYFKLNEFDSSILELNNPIIKELSKDNIEDAIYLLANSYYKIKEYENAIKTYNELNTKYPNNKFKRDAQYATAWANFQLRRYNEAYKLFHFLSEGNDSIAVNSFFWKGESKRYNNDNQEALKIFDEFVRKYSSPTGSFGNKMIPKVNYHIGLIYYSDAKFTEAYNFFLKATGTPDPNDRARVLSLLGEIELLNKNYVQALRFYNSASEVSTNKNLGFRGLLGLAMSKYHTGDYKNSLDILTQIEKESPSFEADKMNYYIAENYFKLGNYKNSLDYFQRSLRRLSKGEDERIYLYADYGRAYSYFNLKDYVNAEFQFRDVLKNYGGSRNSIITRAIELDVKLRIADCSFANKKYDEANKLYAEILKDRSRLPNSDYINYHYALSLFRNNERTRALEELRKFKDNYPRSEYYENVLYLIGWIAFQQGNYTEAISNYKAFLVLVPNSKLKPLIYYSLGDSYFNQGSYDSSIAYYNVIINQYSNSNYVFDALNGINYSYVAKGTPQVAIQQIDDFVKNNPNSPFADRLALKKGEIYYSIRDYERAKQSYRDFIAYYSKSKYVADAYYWIGKSSENLGQVQDAINNYTIVFDRYSDTEIAVSALVELGNLHIKNSKYNEAIQVFERGSGLFKNSNRIAELLFLKGDAYLKKGDKANAYDVFDEVSIYYSENIFGDKSKLEIGKIELSYKRYDNAVRNLQALVKKRTDDIGAEAQYNLGLVFHEQKKYSEAITEFVRVGNIFSNYIEWVAKASLMIGDSYEKINDKNRAREIYRTIITKHGGDEYGKEAQRRLRAIR